ncbi:DUF4238 domain-containing protein [Sphaerospermopsis aphanizomenoides BCCUSP55]|uniref:DUF4238 domain-containing protein n=1 Tax=Sphaerospermopsis aphanizomenoides TaxID=459663 RepID=UPI0019089B0C|nr:DUF4238 domain-containing protein [Sphaerospermopsis aphanizomenoides]MBK1988923.1 DUF4238 domain-containing protein [Sphaerospermopsis aphanizomenoides BCCUSP55]
MEKPKKNQHYVPKSYLENFSIDPNKNEKQIFVFDKFTQTKFSNNIKKIPLERYFYDFPEILVSPGEDPQKVENFFTGLESRQKKLLNHIQKKIDGIFNLREKSHPYSKKVLNQSQKIDLSYVVAFQLFRTKEFRNSLLEMREVTKPLLDKSIEQEINEIITQGAKECSITLNEESTSEIQSMLFDRIDEQLSFMYKEGLSVIHSNFMDSYYETASQILRKHIYLIGINDTDKPLFTSDHPVVQYPHLGLNGINSPGIEIAFPINSKAILIMKEKSHFHEFAKLDSNLFPLTLNDVDFYNQLQVYGSTRFAFCSETQFDLADESCRNNPNVCSSNKTRIQLKEIPADAS